MTDVLGEVAKLPRAILDKMIAARD
jgi:hypothetical protein